MPDNRLIYLGVLLTAASALMWIGAELARRAEWILPYTGGAGVLAIVLGLLLQARKDKPASVPGGSADEAAASAPEGEQS